MNNKEYQGMKSIISIMPTLLFIAAMAKKVNEEFKTISDISTSQEFENWMSNIWKLYGRKQPRHYIAD